MLNNKCNNLKIIVVGLPRSGTSFLTNLISTMGFNLGAEDWLKKPDERNVDGYFECLPLSLITNRFLYDLNCDFHFNLPSRSDLESINVNNYADEIYNIVCSGNIEIYKDNKLTIMPDVFDKLFPDVYWVYIERPVLDTYQSRFGKSMNFSDWVDITNRRKDLWLDSDVSKKALKLNYDQFKHNLSDCVDVISEYLNIKLSVSVKNNCLRLFRFNR